MPVSPQQPIVTFFDPNKRDRGLIEFWDTSVSSYVPLDIGTPHPNTRDYPGFKLGIQVALPNDDKFVKRVWVSDETNPDWFNYEIRLSQEANACPVFIRQYRVDKRLYSAKAKGLALDAVIKLTVTNAGSGYVPGTFPNLAFSAGNAVAHAVVNLDGTIAEFVLDDGGSGYAVAPTFTVDPPPSGTTATGTAFIQPQGAVLVEEQAKEFPRDSEFYGLYFDVTRVYETLPGPYITTSRVDEDGKTITVQRRHNLQSTIDAITPRETLSGNVWTRITSEPVNESYFVGWEVRETRAIPGNPITETTLDKDGNDVEVVRTLKDVTSITTGETTTGNCSSGTYVKTYAKAVSDLVAWEYVETIVIPGHTVETTKFRSDGSNIVILTTLKKTSCITPGGNLAGGFLSLTRIEDVGSDVVSHEVVEVSLVPGPDVHGKHIDEKYGLIFDIIKTIVPDGTAPSPNPAVDGTYYEIKPHDKWQSVQIATKLDTGSLPSPVVTYGGQHHGDFPPVLVDAVIEWADATCGCVEKFRAVLQDNYKHYRGVVKARYTEQFYNGVPPDDVTVYQFFPQQHTFGFAFAAVCGCGSDSTSRITAIAPQFHIPLCLHDDITLCVGGGLGCVGAPFAWTFAATTPSLSTYPASSYIMLQPHVERWRFGVYRRVLTEIFVPPLT